MGKKPIVIDSKKCVGCGLCASDCVGGYIYVKDGKARTKKAGCIECGHCFAICPQNAVIMKNYDTSDCGPAVSMDAFDSDLLLEAMKSRRTIRQFTEQPVEETKIKKILEAGRYCPTAVNAQNVSYTILGSKQDEIEKMCVQMLRKAQGGASHIVKKINEFKIDDHFFFKGAPLVIVVTSKSKINGGLASSYMELMAESMGLGVLYSGFFETCIKINPKVKKLLELPRGHKVISCMIIGYPSVKYQRTVPRKALKVNRL